MMDLGIESNVLGDIKWSFLGTQSNAKAERLKKLGWKPYRPSLFDSLEKDIDASMNKPEN
jgi:hypothetical protein